MINVRAFGIWNTTKQYPVGNGKYTQYQCNNKLGGYRISLNIIVVNILFFNGFGGGVYY